ncbi:unnamed protein product [Cuscuta campestris]|uniref:Uncharacterized protein n=1 Tax=Cuscuta campestris TaxID=132261 RepID=A0A484KQH8_9ASTE|nr:unnamed protein product [Cuscuta campestris]
MYITGDRLRSIARSNKNQTPSKDFFTMRKTTDYERQRELNIERNNKRFQELGIPALGSSLKRVKANVIENNVADGDDEYVPTYEERMHAKDDESIALKKNSTLKTSFKNPISRQTSSSKPHTQMIFSDEMFEASSNPEMTNLATSMGRITRGKETGVSGVERLNQHRIHAYNLNGGASERQASITRSTTSQNDFVRVPEREETGMFEVESLNQHHTHGSNFDGGAFERQAPPTRSTTSQRDFLRVQERDEVAGLHEYRTPGDMDGVSFKRQAPITRSRTSQREILPVHERGSRTTNILMNTSVGDENHMNSSVQQATPVLRGKTKCQNWKRKRDIIPNKVEIEIPPELNRVVGMNSTQFISEASYLMKQCMPLDVEDWGHIHPDKKRKYFMKLKELFKLPEGHHGIESGEQTPGIESGVTI